MRQQMILGFDARANWCPRDLLWPPERRRGFLLSDVDRPLSADVFVWPSVFADRQLGLPGLEAWDLGPAGLPAPAWRGALQDLWADPVDMRAAIPERADRPCDIVAFTGADWPAELAPPVPGQPEHDWELLGYDVVDRWLLSGLMNCGYGEDEASALRERWAGRLNAHHLFVDDEEAAAFAAVSDARVPEHAPFAPCGIWRLSS